MVFSPGAVIWVHCMSVLSKVRSAPPAPLTCTVSDSSIHICCPGLRECKCVIPPSPTHVMHCSGRVVILTGQTTAATLCPESPVAMVGMWLLCAALGGLNAGCLALSWGCFSFLDADNCLHLLLSGTWALRPWRWCPGQLSQRTMQQTAAGVCWCWHPSLESQGTWFVQGSRPGQ